MYVVSSSPSSVDRASTSFFNVPAFTNRTRTVSHSKCDISSSESYNQIKSILLRILHVYGGKNALSGWGRCFLKRTENIVMTGLVTLPNLKINYIVLVRWTNNHFKKPHFTEKLLYSGYVNCMDWHRLNCLEFKQKIHKLKLGG